MAAATDADAAMNAGKTANAGGTGNAKMNAAEIMAADMAENIRKGAAGNGRNGGRETGTMTADARTNHPD